MQQDTLTQAADVPVERKLIEAIALKRLVVVEYNAAEMHLAPHRLFTRHGDLYLSAFNTRKNWRSEDDWRLGDFKVIGLSKVELTETPFEPLPSYDGSPSREGDQQLFTVEIG